MAVESFVIYAIMISDWKLLESAKMTELDIERYHKLAQQKQKEHRKFLATLKKKAPKNLDKITQEIHT